MVVHLLSPNNRYDMLYLRNYAVLNVKDRPGQDPGRRARCGCSVPCDYAMRLWLNHQKIAERKMTADAAGVINGCRAYGVTVRVELLLRAVRPRPMRRISEASSRSDSHRVVTRLSDVADRVEVQASQYGLRSLLDNKQAVAIPIFQAPGSNAIQISDNVRATMEELKTNFPQGLEYRIVYDQARAMRRSPAHHRHRAHPVRRVRADRLHQRIILTSAEFYRQLRT